MPEIRQNLITRQWVIIPTEHAVPPEEFKRERPSQELPERDPECHFCPGNEKETPGEVYRYPENGDWQVRVVPNRESALALEGTVTRVVEGVKRSISGVGVHEVIVQSPAHNAVPALMPVEEWSNVIRANLARYQAAHEDQRVEAVTIFKNHGKDSGTTIEHPHWQLIGTPVIPPDLRERLEWALRFYDDNGMCVFCATLQDEMRGERRIVAENENFVAFVPYAALSPFHLWIFPRRHSATFGRLAPEEVPSFAKIVREVLQRIYTGLGDPGFNMMIRTAPKETDQVRYYHWYMSIVPRLTRPAGFEMGSGMFINNSIPEATAQYLREVKLG